MFLVDTPGRNTIRKKAKESHEVYLEGLLGVDKKIREQVKGTLRNSFSISKIAGPTNRASPSEADWKPSYRNQRKGKHITPAISVCVYTIGPTFIARAFSYESTSPEYKTLWLTRS